ncbi:BZ3500_MvSof-1268-A1-R1_Chr5-3g08197 [Microbotryum saponariae]|uniref:BZ3500_MvSof-1268-A1-R1_Chr5-3g08197 protein n=1 Tax=Microbotryum saponariae TaxID=289078 RepID=A0A2X0NP14_9BASI|nr:BZ3500_MvSof-1268-A1-R1_Chr5-3g08197 [Microbotryum saponariae]SDA07956.1 BZ3501_MvSof-1269-A2-R1_Chr5-1g07341 [Microbotryum saponariae]
METLAAAATPAERRTDSRLAHDTKGLVLPSEALKAYIISDDSELDALAVGVQWPAGQKWGSEDGFKIFVADDLRGVRHAPAMYFCSEPGSTQLMLRHSDTQVSSQSKVVVCGKSGKFPSVFDFMELKSTRGEWYAAEAQVLRHLYWMTSTHPIRRWVFAATMCGCYLRVYVHTPAGIIHTTQINCASPNGWRILKRTILRILNGDLLLDLDWKIGQAGGRCGWEITQ